MVNDPLLWLRLLTGNGDPSGPNLVVVSAGAASSAWGKVTADVLAPGAAVGNLGFTPLNRAGDTTLGDLVVSRANSGTPSDGVLYLGTTGGQYLIAKLGAIINIRGGLLQIDNGATIIGATVHSGLTTLNGTVTVNGPMTLNGVPLQVNAGNISVIGDIHVERAAPANATGYIFFGTHTLGFDGTRLAYDGSSVWHAGNQGTNSGLNADTLRGLIPGNGANQIAISNGVATTGLYAARAVTADSLASYTFGNAVGNVPLNNSTVNNGLIAARAEQLQTYVPGNGNGNVPVSNGAENANLNAALLNGQTAAQIIAAAAGGGVHAGIIAFIANASLPSGWDWYVPLNGRVLLGAGSAGVANNQTFTAGTSYPTSGANWGHADTVNIQHAHGVTTQHTHGASGLSVAGHTGAPNPMTANLNVTAGPGGEVYVGNHSHDATADGGTMDVGGTTDNAAPGGTDNAGSTAQATAGVVWIPPSHALNAIIKS